MECGVAKFKKWKIWKYIKKKIGTDMELKIENEKTLKKKHKKILTKLQFKKWDLYGIELKGGDYFEHKCEKYKIYNLVFRGQKKDCKQTKFNERWYIHSMHDTHLILD